MPLRVPDAIARVRKFPRRLVFFQRAIRFTANVANFVVRTGGVVLAVFLIHQLFFWLSKDPEKAFNFATLVIDVIEIVWDLFGILYNPLADIANTVAIPLWNAFSFYAIEPAVFLVLEVFSLVFLRHKYEGLIDEAGFPYGGFVCDSSEVSEAWCGRFGAYNERLISSGSVSSEQSTVFGATAEGRRMLHEHATITFGIATARRLSEISGEANIDVPSFETAELVGALDGLSTQAIVMGGSAADLFFGVLYNVLSTSAVVIFDAVFTVLKTVFDIFKMLIKSGIIQFLLGIGLDFLFIIVFEVYLPYVFAMIDAVTCLLQLFMWKSWEEQLQCGKHKKPKHPCRDSNPGRSGESRVSLNH